MLEADRASRRQVVYRKDDRVGPRRRQYEVEQPRYEPESEDDTGNDGLEVDLDSRDRLPSGSGELD